MLLIIVSALINVWLNLGEGNYDIFEQFKEDIQRRLSDTAIEWKRQA